jgi:hypothetical protein
MTHSCALVDVVLQDQGDALVSIRIRSALMIAHFSNRYRALLVVTCMLGCVGACVLAMHVGQAELRWMMKAALLSESLVLVGLVGYTSRWLVRR